MNPEPKRAEFDAALLQWREATMHLSDPAAIRSDPFARRIAAMGRAVVPWLLEIVRDDPCIGTLQLLHEITGVDPITPSIAGDVVAMASAWLSWGKRRGHI